MPSFLSPKTPHPHQHPQSPNQSPNYFGIVSEPASASIPHHNGPGIRTPAAVQSPRIRSAAANSPAPISRQASAQDLDVFKKQMEQNSTNLRKNMPPPLNGGSFLPKSETKLTETPATTSSRDRTPPKSASGSLATKVNGLGEDAESTASRSPKRVLSQDGSPSFERPSFISGGSNNTSKNKSASLSGSPPSRRDEKLPRLSPPREVGKDQNHPLQSIHYRGETMPTSFDQENPSMVSSQHLASIINAANEDTLILDLRVSTQYAKARIVGALNLCIPTTLLKRPSYNVERLADTFKDDGQRGKFEQWRTCRSIVAYDTSASQLKDAANCINILKKFTSQDWDGNAFIVRGGFNEFSQKFPSLLESHSTADRSPSPNKEVAPVIGGCPMPATKNAANPFFGNIRQNMDLIGGVGQFPIRKPRSTSKHYQYDLPRWLSKVADDHDDGKTVATRFLNIEKREQKRMQYALSGNVSYQSNSGRNASAPQSPMSPGVGTVQIAGLEKGGKNRYNNIWPFEHSRVKLQDVPHNGCDYVNANFLSTSVSPKRYIATQGPVPTTFADFWTMVWQRDVRAIVMLTAETEGGQVKAHNYWDRRQYGPITLEFLGEHRATLETELIHRSGEPNVDKERRRLSHLDALRSPPPVPASSAQTERIPPTKRKDGSNGAVGGARDTGGNCDSDFFPHQPMDTKKESPYVIVRTFALSHASYPFERMREITQLQYSHWPDFGTPAHPAHLLGLVEQTDSVVRRHGNTGVDGTERPVLVHCSAGCGRTGTFCTVDTVVDVIKRQRTYRPRREARHTSPMDLDTGRSGSSSQGFLPLQPGKDNHDKDSSKNRGEVKPPAKHNNRQENSQSDSIEQIWLGDENLDLVEKVVEEFRHQRLSMVQSLRQFVLCYEAVLQWICEHGWPKSA